jgi:hypothetical protein
MRDNFEAYCKALDRISRTNRRKFLNQQIADAKRIARGLKAAGVPVRAATIAGIPFEFGELESRKEATLTPLEKWRAKHARSA